VNGTVHHALVGRLPRTLLLTVLAAITACTATASQIAFGSLDASLDTGSLAGTTFPVSFSYDASQINAIGESFIFLNSFDFTLLGTTFMRSEISQGGQAIFRNGVLDNVTASFQDDLPPGAPVANITFGFGGPGVIGYIDLARNSATGSFAFAQIPEPGTLGLSIAGLLLWRRLSP
jgi:hypothetical protein